MSENKAEIYSVRPFIGNEGAWYDLEIDDDGDLVLLEDYESVVQQRDALEKRLADVVVDNAALNKFIKDDCWVWDDKNETYFDAIDGIPETPATDAFTREMMAKGVDALAAKYRNITETMHPDTIAYGALKQEFEPVIKEANKFAAQLRKGINDAQ